MRLLLVLIFLPISSAFLLRDFTVYNHLYLRLTRNIIRYLRKWTYGLFLIDDR